MFDKFCTAALAKKLKIPPDEYSVINIIVIHIYYCVLCLCDNVIVDKT